MFSPYRGLSSSSCSKEGELEKKMTNRWNENRFNETAELIPVRSKQRYTQPSKRSAVTINRKTARRSGAVSQPLQRWRKAEKGKDIYTLYPARMCKGYIYPFILSTRFWGWEAPVSQLGAAAPAGSQLVTDFRPGLAWDSVQRNPETCGFKSHICLHMQLHSLTAWFSRTYSTRLEGRF